MSNSFLSTRKNSVKSVNVLKKLSRLICLIAFFVIANETKGQTTITVGGGASITCPAVPTATWTTPPTGITFSNWSRGSGVTCSSASTALSGSAFQSASASAAVTAGKYYAVTITADATHTFTLSSIVWSTAVSGTGTTCSFGVMYSNNGGAVTAFGSTGTSTSSNTFNGSVTINAGTSLILYLTPFNCSSSTATVRWSNGSTITGTGALAATSPTINGSASATAFTTTYGTASTAQTFSVSGAALTADLIATAPTGFELSRDGGTTYKDTVIFTQSSGTASGSLKVRLKATATVSGTYNSQNIVLSSTDATSVNIVTASTGNAVSAKAITISGLSAANKSYDGNKTVSINGTPSYNGLVNGETFSVTGTVSWAFADSSVGNNKTLTRTGTFDAPSSNYTVTQPTLTASILALSAPALTAASSATVDAPFSVTFIDNANWRAAITDIKVGATSLIAAAYSNTSGTINLVPSASVLLQSAGSKTIVVIATNYINDTIIQSIAAGVPAKLSMNTQPTAPATNGGALATQPKVNIQDQYGNATSSSATVTAVADSITWTLNGTTSVAASAGVTTFTGLTATSTASVASAKIIFSSAGLTSVSSNAFAIPTPPPANDLCANATSISVNGGNAIGSLVAATNTTNSLTYASAKTDVWYKFVPDVTGNDTVTLTFTAATSRDIDIDVFNSASCPTTGAATYTSHGSTTTETITGAVTAGNTYYIRVIDYGSTNGGSFNISVKGPANPVIAATGSLSAFSSNYGTASASQSVAVSGTKLVGSILATAPTGFEVSRDGGNNYKDTVIFAQSGGNVNGTLNVRLKSTATVGAYDSKNIVLSSTSAVSVNITTTASGNIVSAVVPSTPRVDTAVAGNAQATVFFTAPVSNGGSSITGYTVTSNPDGISINGTSSPITVTGLTNGTAYTFTVVATNVAGNSSPSDASIAVTPTSDPVVPGIPVIGTATAGNAQATITFIAPVSDGGSAITSYTAVSNPGNITATVNQAESGSITVTGLTNGTAYTFTIYATNGIGNSLSSTASNSIIPKTTASAPVINSITIGNKQLSVLFSAPTSNGGATITNYKYSINGGASFIACSPAQTTSPIALNGLTNGTNYDIQILAVNAVGDGSASATLSAVPATTAGAPTITAINPGNTQLSVAFIAPASDSGSAITNYKYSTNGGTNYIACSPAQTTSPIIITGLTNATTYTIKIKAVNSIGDGNASASMTGTPRKAEPIAQPTSLVISSITTTSMSLAFTGAAGTPDGYLVVRSTSNTLSALPIDTTVYTVGTSLGGGIVVSAGSTTSSIVNTSLTAGTTYYFFVFAYNNSSKLIDYLTNNPLTASASTLSAAPVPTASNIAGFSFDVNWPAVTGANAYVLSVSSNAGFTSLVSGFDSVNLTGLSQTITGLQAGTIYYFRVKAINASGSSTYGTGNTTTLALTAPVANTASSITSTSFIANWDSVPRALSYRLDVSKSPTFGTTTSATLSESFETGLATSYPTSQINYTLSSGSWSMLNVMRNSAVANVASGAYSAQIKKDATANITSPALSNVGTVSFSCIAGTVASGGLKVQKSVNGGAFTDVQTFTISTTSSRYTCSINDSSSNVLIRFISTAAQTLYLDSVQIAYSNVVSSFVTGYQNLTVNGRSQLVSGLRNGTNYYYRVRAYSTNSTSSNSNTISLVTDSTILQSPLLVADTLATVDNPFTVSFTEDPNWRDALTGIALNGASVSDSAFSKTTEGQIIFTPAFSALLQTPGTKTLIFLASGYTNDTLLQTIKVGVPNKLAIFVQPTAPATNGGILATQPKITVRDQYGNQTISTIDITAAAETNTWTLNGSVTSAAVNGIASFSNLTASSSTAVASAKIIFSSLGLLSVSSNSFSIPPPPPANDSCSGAVNLTANTGIVSGTFVSATPISGSTYKDVFYSFTPQVTGTFTILINGFSAAGDRDLYVYSTCPATYSTSTNVVGSGTATSTTIDSVKTTFTAGVTYKIMVQDYAGAGGTFNIAITGPAAYFSKSSGSLHSLSSWGSNPDGSGSAPTSFTAANQTFVIKNNPTPTIDSSWTVSGTGSKVVLGDSINSINFTIPSGATYTGNLDIASNSTLTLLNATNSTITFGKLSSGSTVDFASTSSQTIPAGNYWNLSNSGNGRRVLSATGTIGVAGTYTPTTDSITVTASTVNFNGTNAQSIPASNYNNLTTSNISGCTTTGNVSVANLLTVSQQLTIGAASILTMLPGDSVIIAAGKNLTVSATGTIQNNSTRIFNFNSTGTMTVNGVYVHNANSQTIPSSTYATYKTGSIIKVGDGGSNITTTNPILPANAYDVIWNCPSQTQTNIFISSTPTSVHDLTIINTGSGYISNGFQTTARTLNISGNLTLQGGNYNIIGNGSNTVDQTLNITGNLSVSGGKLNLNSGLSTSNSIVNLSGNLIHVGGIITATNTSTGKGTFVFNGTTPQSTDSIGSSNLINVTVSNTSGVTLNNDLTVSGTLTFTSGKIITGSNKLISTGTILGGGTGWVIGNLQKNVSATGSKTFEIGGANYYRPVSINVSSLDSAGVLTASVSQQDNNHPNLSTSLISPNKSIKRYFTLTPGNGLSALYDAVFNFNIADQPAGGLDSAKLFVGNYNGSNWTYPTVGTATASSIQITGTRLFGDFAIGEKSTPVAVALNADSITPTSARLNGTVNDNGFETSTGFNYGTTSNYGNSVVANPPVVAANAGVTPVSASISSLTANTQYTFRVNATNALGTTNSTGLSFYTLAFVPGAPVVDNPTPTTLNVTITANGNPSYTLFAIHETTTNQYLQANGSLGSNAVWQTASVWGTKTVIGLTANTTYTFEVQAKNGDNVLTAFGTSANGTTIERLSQTISSIAASVTKTYGDTTYRILATASSSLAVSYSSSDTTVAKISLNGTVTIVGAGIATLSVNQTGNAIYSAAPTVSQLLTVNKSSQTITFNALPSKTTVDVDFAISATTTAVNVNSLMVYTSSDTTIAKIISGNIVRIVSAGSVNITASNTGNNNYLAAIPVSQVLNISAAIAKWTFEGITSTNTGKNIILSAGSAVADLGAQPSGSLFSAYHKSASTSWSNPNGNGSLKSVLSTNWDTADYYKFKVNTTNFSDLKVIFDMRGSNTGPSTFKLQYSLNDTSYTDFGPQIKLSSSSWSPTIPDTTATKLFNLSTLSILNNQPAVYFRIVNVNKNSIGGSTIGSGGTNAIDNFMVTGNSNLLLNVKTFLEGFYTGNSTMATTLYDYGLSTDPTATDSVTVNLWSPDAVRLPGASPSYSYKGILHSNGKFSVNLPKTILGNSYYIAVKHRNSIETWSANTIKIAESNYYNFTDSLSKAYSNGYNQPMKNMDGVYAIYSGDVNLDGTVDIYDMQSTENDAFNFFFGYNPTDCNGDLATDALDMQIIENNTSYYIFLARPM